MPEKRDIERDETEKEKRGDIEVDESSIEKPESPKPAPEIPISRVSIETKIPHSAIPSLVTNGKKVGLINGRKPRRPQKVAPTRSRTGRLVIAITIVILIASGCIPLLMPIREGPRVVDGDFSKWSGAQVFSDSNGRYSLMIRENVLLAFFEGRSSLFTPKGVVWVIIDSDGMANTGYLFKDIGGDYLYEVSGENGSITASTVFSFDHTRAQTDWNGFRNIDSLPAASDRSKVEMGYTLLGGEKIRAYFVYVSGGQTTVSHSFVVVNGGVLLCSVEPLVSVAKNETRIMKINLEAWGREITITDLKFSGEGVRDIVVYSDGSPLGSSISPGVVQLSPSVKVSDGETRAIDIQITPSAPSGDTAFLTLTGVGSESHLSMRGKLTVPVYAHTPGNEYQIDGLFGEWVTPSEDPTGDVKDRSGRNVNDPSGDIQYYSSYDSSSGSYHYLKVERDILAGVLIPATTPKNRPPQGPVHVNITLPPEELLNEDRIYILFDSDSDVSTGYAQGSIGADSAVLIRGVNGRIIGSSRLMYAGNGSSWKWENTSGNITAEASGASIEVYVESLQGSAYFYLLRWSGNRDTASSVLVIDAPASDPYIIEGVVTDENGAQIPGLLVEVCNDRTGECLYAFTGSGGYYQVDFSNLPSGYQNGDGITVTATNTTSGKQGTATGTVDTSQGGSRIDVNIPAGERIFLASIWAVIFAGFAWRKFRYTKLDSTARGQP